MSADGIHRLVKKPRPEVKASSKNARWTTTGFASYRRSIGTAGSTKRSKNSHDVKNDAVRQSCEPKRLREQEINRTNQITALRFGSKFILQKKMSFPALANPG